MDKAPDAFRTISEVADELDIPQHVLRFWETRFSQIKPMKRSGGRRYYRPDDVDLLKGIRRLLYSEGYTIRGVQRILKEHGIKSVQGLADSSAAVSFGAIEEAIGQSLVEEIDKEDAPATAEDEEYEGADEDGNVEVPSRAWGARPTMNAAAEHFDIGERLGMMDFERAAKVSGARFVYLKGALSRLERALGMFMLDLHTEQFGYTEMSPPLMVRDDAAFGTGQLPKFESDLFFANSIISTLDMEGFKCLQQLCRGPNPRQHPSRPITFWRTLRCAPTNLR